MIFKNNINKFDQNSKIIFFHFKLKIFKILLTKKFKKNQFSKLDIF